MMPAFKDLTGHRYGRLTVVERASNSESGRTRWLCKCDCGNSIVTLGNSLQSGRTKSCGCYQQEHCSHVTHGMTRGGKIPRLYHVWLNMKDRCSNPNNCEFKNYGGRGIDVCEEWANDFKRFNDWAMANGFKNGLEIDRIDNDQGYSPDNCRFVTRSQNMRNRSDNRWITVLGETQCLSDWAKTAVVSPSLICYHAKRDGDNGESYIESKLKAGDAQCSA